MTDPDDLAAFHAAVADATPLLPPNRVFIRPSPPPPRPVQRHADERAVLHDSLFAPLSLQDRLEGGDEANYLRGGLSQSVLRDLRRGRWVIHDELDLHGLNRDEARALLGEFLAHALHWGKRCVRIIHGKGHRSPQKLSVLKQLVRGWLAQRDEVLAFCQAKPHDGGEGALIVLLRAPKNQRAAP